MLFKCDLFILSFFCIRIKKYIHKKVFGLERSSQKHYLGMGKAIMSSLKIIKKVKGF